MTAVSPKEAYGLLASQYDAHPNPLVSLERRVMLPLLPPLNRRRVIDAGSGTGRWARYCASHGAKVVALDFSRQMLERGPRPAVEGDLRELPFRDASADLTVCSFALGYAPGCIRELARITRPGGVVLVSDMHPEAIQRGWNRSFRHSSGVIHIDHQPYHLEDLQTAELELSCLLEPKFGLAEHQIFINAGHGARFEEASREPAIFVARWTRR
jgi:malonyl-CoA O-methyltransferase